MAPSGGGCSAATSAAPSPPPNSCQEPGAGSRSSGGSPTSVPRCSLRSSRGTAMRYCSWDKPNPKLIPIPFSTLLKISKTLSPQVLHVSFSHSGNEFVTCSKVRPHFPIYIVHKMLPGRSTAGLVSLPQQHCSTQALGGHEEQGLALHLGLQVL